MEQPTLFYATVVILAILAPSPLAVLLAWIYVGLRIVHSVWQAMVNIVSVRFLLFLAYSLALIALAILALIATLGGPA